MFKLGRMTDYAVGLMAMLARSEAETLRSSEIARSVELPETTVAKILKGLAHGGLLVSHRGARGGYALARPAAEITVGDIVRAVEGPVALTDCLEADEGCERESDCRVRGGLQKINGAVQNVLDHMSLAEMAADGAEHPAAKKEVRHV